MIVNIQKAEAELAYELQAAKTKQRIKDEQMQIKVVERTQEILVQVLTRIFTKTSYRLMQATPPIRNLFLYVKILGTRNPKEGKRVGLHS